MRVQRVQVQWKTGSEFIGELYQGRQEGPTVDKSFLTVSSKFADHIFLSKPAYKEFLLNTVQKANYQGPLKTTEDLVLTVISVSDSKNNAGAISPLGNLFTDEELQKALMETLSDLGYKGDLKDSNGFIKQHEKKYITTLVTKIFNLKPDSKKSLAEFSRNHGFTGPVETAEDFYAAYKYFTEKKQ